jgi:hypothetical protein
MILLVNSYGRVSTRTVHRRLFRLQVQRLVIRYGWSVNTPDAYYRLSKTAIKRLYE